MERIFVLARTLGLTILIEYPLTQILWIFYCKRDKSISKNPPKLTFFKGMLIIIPVVIINVLTNPAINFYAQNLWLKLYPDENLFWTIITAWEVVIFLVEGVLYKFMLKTTWLRGMLLSLCSNGVSYLSSFIIS